MNKRITSLFLCLAMVFAMAVYAVPAFAVGTAKTVWLTPDKTDVKPGDVVTYTCVMGPISEKVGSIDITVTIPTGMTFVANSGALADGLKTTLGANYVDWTEGSLLFNAYGMGYTNEADTTLFTFQCKVNADVTGKLDVSLTNIAFGDEFGEGAISGITYIAKSGEVTSNIPATGISLDKTVLKMEAGDKETLTATLTPAGTTDTTDKVVWTSSNTAVATVKDGEVTAVKEGTATITATINGNVKATCQVEVEACLHKTINPVAAKTDAKCDEFNYSAHYKCAKCEQLFSDAEGKNEITFDSIKTAGTIHKGEANVYVANNNGTHTVKYATCGHVADDDEACTGGTAKCNAEAVCSACKTAYGTVDKTNHASTKVYIKANNSGQTHGKYYECCDAFMENERCSGGEKATCKTKSVCQVCEKPYGNLDPENHESKETKTVSNGDNTHDIVHECCEAVITDNQPCSGGTATCTTLKKCTVCGGTYGETLPHTYNTDWVNGGDGYHYHECTATDCDEWDKATREAHKGGEATCTKQAVCSECNEEYGKLLDHVDENKDDKCDKCGFNMRKPEGCDHKLDKDGKCSRCGIIIITYDGDKPSNGNESNPNTGAPAPVSAVAAVAVLAAAAYVASKRK